MNPKHIILTPNLVSQIWQDLFPRNAKIAAANAVHLAVSGGWLDRVKANGENKTGGELWDEFAALIERGDQMLEWNDRVRAPTWDWLANMLPKGMTFPKRETLQYDCQTERVSPALTAYVRRLAWERKKKKAGGGS